MNPLFSISHIASSRHSPATFKPIIIAQRCSSALRATLSPIIVAQRCSLALPGETFAHYRCPTVLLGTPGRHLSLLSSPNGTPRHSRATLSPIIVAQRYSLALPGDTFVHYCRPTVLPGTTGRHFRPLLSPNGTGLTYSLTSQIPPSLKSLDSSPPPFKPHSPATFKPIIVAQRCSSALPGDTYAHYRCPTMFLGTTGRHFRPLLSPNGAGLTYSLTSQIPPSLKSLDSSPPPFKPHSPATFKPIIVAQRCSSALPGDIYQPFCRPTVLA